MAGEIKEPKKNVPRALTLGVLLLTVIYILTSAVFLYLVPLAKVTSDETFAVQAGEALFGLAGGKIFAVVVIISVVGTLLAYLEILPFNPFNHIPAKRREFELIALAPYSSGRTTELLPFFDF